MFPLFPLFPGRRLPRPHKRESEHRATRRLARKAARSASRFVSGTAIHTSPERDFCFLHGIEDFPVFIPGPGGKKKTKTGQKVEGLNFDLAFYGGRGEFCRGDVTVCCF